MKKLASMFLAITLLFAIATSSSVSAADTLNEEAKKLVSDYLDKFQGYEFSKVASIGNKTTFLNAIDKVEVVYDTGIKETAEYCPEVRSDALDVTLSAATIKVKADLTKGEGGATIDHTLWHETIHAIEDTNGDFDVEGKSEIRDYDERNIEYMEVVVRALDKLREVEGYAKKGETDEQLRARYEEFLTLFNTAANAPGPKAYPVDFAQLKGWMGFYVQPDKIMDHYASGAAGDRLKTFAEHYNGNAASSWGKYSWEGEWESNWGDMVLSQGGGAVTGTYTWELGRITGTVSGNTLVGTWSESPSYSPDKDAGAIEFTMSDDGKTFTGKWCYGSSGSWQGWQGTKRITAVIPAPVATATTPKNNIIVQINNPNMSSNGTLTTLDSAPILLNNRTVLPIRAVVEAMGGTVGWDQGTRKVTISVSGTVIEMWLDKNTIQVNGQSKKIDVAPTVIGGRTMVPVRFVADNIPGCTIQWNDATQSATISY